MNVAEKQKKLKGLHKVKKSGYNFKDYLYLSYVQNKKMDNQQPNPII